MLLFHFRKKDQKIKYMYHQEEVVIQWGWRRRPRWRRSRGMDRERENSDSENPNPRVLPAPTKGGWKSIFYILGNKGALEYWSLHDYAFVSFGFFGMLNVLLCWLWREWIVWEAGFNEFEHEFICVSQNEV